LANRKSREIKKAARQLRVKLTLVRVPDTLTSITVPILLVWLGLRAMAKYRPDRIVVPAKLSNRVLKLLRQTEHKTKQSEALAQWMIAWLERCSAADWTLLPDTTRLILPP
jgi:hypothetical protein